MKSVVAVCSGPRHGPAQAPGMMARWSPSTRADGPATFASTHVHGGPVGTGSAARRAAGGAAHPGRGDPRPRRRGPGRGAVHDGAARPGPGRAAARSRRPSYARGGPVEMCEATAYDVARGPAVRAGDGLAVPGAHRRARAGRPAAAARPRGRGAQGPAGELVRRLPRRRGVALDHRRGRPSPGPGVVWMRPTVELVEGEPMSPVQRLMTCVDSASGVSAALDPAAGGS